VAHWNSTSQTILGAVGCGAAGGFGDADGCDFGVWFECSAQSAVHLLVDVLCDVFGGGVLAAGGLVEWCGLVEVAVVELIEDGVEGGLCGVKIADEAVLVEAVALDFDGCSEVVAVEGFLLAGDGECVGSGEG